MKPRSILVISALLMIVALVFLHSCHDEEEEPFPEPLELSAILTHVSEFGNNDGSIDLTVSGGLTPCTFSWSNNQTTEDIDSLTAGFYIVTVVDMNDEAETDTFLIIQPALNELIIEYAYTYPSETGASDGSIDITIYGGYPPYAFQWSNGSTLEDLDDISAGSYSVNVEDSKDQTAVAIIVLSDIVTDIDGNTYKVVRIGEQLWMHENLKVIHAPGGTSITGYAYGDDEKRVDTYGRLYTWDVAMNGSVTEESQGICPCGWHIPSDEEFKELEMHLGMTRGEADMVNFWRGAGVGTSLITGGSSGYDALLSGRRTSAGTYNLISFYEYMWTSSEYGNGYAWRRCLDLSSDLVGRWNTFPKDYGFSVRCVKDE